MHKIVGIDPGLAATGVGIVCGRGIRVAGCSYGCIRTPASANVPARLNQIYSQIARLLDDERPHMMVVEDVFSLQRYPKSGLLLGKVCGVILLAGARAEIPIREIQVREAKKVLTGNGAAGKSQLERAVRHVLQLEEPIHPSHASDALGLALVGLYRCRGTGGPRNPTPRSLPAGPMHPAPEEGPKIR